MKVRKEWGEFKLEMVKVPRVAGSSADCPCPLCRCAKFNPIGVVGEKEVVSKPVVNPSGDQMKCEVQAKVLERGSKVCPICLQITGPAIRHGCSKAQVRQARLGRLPQGRSSQRSVPARRKRNLSLLVGREAQVAQEQITSSALQRIREAKGTSRFKMKLMKGGGRGGMSSEVTVGERKVEQKVLGMDLFTEVKKHLIKSKNKMEKLCKILRKHKVTMLPRVKEKLNLQDHRLDQHYETIKVNLTKTETEEVPIDPNIKTRGRKSAKLTRKVKKVVTIEKDVTILKQPKEFLEKLAEDRFICKMDVMHRISMDGGDNSFKIICNTFSKNQE